MAGRLTLVAEIEAHEDRAWRVAWHPNGRLFASSGTDERVRLWSADTTGTWRCVMNLQGPQKGTIRSVAWSADGQRLATACFDGTSCVWERQGQEYDCVATLEGHENEVKDCGFSPSGNFIATCSRDKTVWIWEHYDDDDEEYDCCANLCDHTQDVKTVKWHPTREILASGSYDDSIIMYREEPDDSNWIAFDKLKGHKSTVWSLAFDRTGQRLVSGSADKTAMIWQAHEPGNPKGIATPSAVDAKWLEACTLSGFHGREVFSVDWSHHDKGWIATGCGDNYIRVFSEVQNTGNGDANPSFELVASVKAHIQDVNCVAWQPPVGDVAPLLASCSDDGTVKLWRVEE